MTPQRYTPEFLYEYAIYALGFVIVCAMATAFWYIKAPVDFRSWW
jgi:hypothetical protein